MSPSISYTLEEVDEQGDTIVVEMRATKPSFMPDFVAKSRARIKAVRIVGAENIGRGAAEMLSQGEVGRATNLINYQVEERDGMTEEVYVLVEVITAGD